MTGSAETLCVALDVALAIKKLIKKKRRGFGGGGANYWASPKAGGFLGDSFFEFFLGFAFGRPLGALFAPSGSQGVPKVSILGAKRCPKSVKNLTFCKTRES